MQKKKLTNKTIFNIACFAIVVILLGYLQATEIENSYAITIIERSCIYAVAAVSMNLMIGFTGQFSLGTAGFMCLGAYI
nr:branched-chain amino acid ABC transporter permease [Pseudobutyrivibrio sp.]